MTLAGRSGGHARQVFALAIVAVLLHVIGNPHYGFFRDELYYIVCGRHPAFGYVDQPPLVPLLAAASQAAGLSLTVLRAVPALFAGLAVYAAGLLAVEMGGGAAAIAFAAIGTALAPVLTLFGTILTTDTPLPALWTAAILMAARAARGDRRCWLAVGLLFGLATETKYTTLIAAASLLGPLVLLEPRTLRAPAFWLGGLIAAVIILPNAAWQAGHGWPMAELVHNQQQGKNVILGPVAFAGQFLLLANPVLAPLWLAGWVGCLARPAWRWLGAGAVLLFGVIVALHGKIYYPAPILPALFASGGVAAEWALSRRPGLRRAALLYAGLGGVLFLPMTMPILPEPWLVAFQGALGLSPPATETHRQPALGQVFADMHGWQELADQVAALRARLPPDTRVFTANYGEAAAIDLLTHGAHPPTLSGHNQYFLWGPQGWTGTVTIDLGGDLADDEALCAHAEIIGRFHADWIMPYEDGRALILCTGLKAKADEFWPSVKHYE